jgi:hypothetical protein
LPSPIEETWNADGSPKRESPKGVNLRTYKGRDGESETPWMTAADLLDTDCEYVYVVTPEGLLFGSTSCESDEFTLVSWDAAGVQW